MRVRLVTAQNQGVALKMLRDIAEEATIDRLVRQTALDIVGDESCRGKNAKADACQLESIFWAVKNGDPNVQALKRGVKYISDPRYADFFTTPGRLLRQCSKSSRQCAEDCESHATLVAALAGAIGFRSGIRAWGPAGQDYEHAYAVVKFPKHRMVEEIALDTSTEEAFPGWEPPAGRIMTEWIG